MFLNSDSVFPFAFNPENVASREVICQDLETLEVKFDMSVKNTPECAAVAVIFDSPKHFDNLGFKLQSGSLNICAELKTLRNGSLVKFREQMVPSDGIVNFSEINKDIKEIVFCCWKTMNENEKGTVKIQLIK